MYVRTALVDARERTTVTVDASAYDTRTKSDGGCNPSGCSADKSRDQNTRNNSRWSCSEALENDQCTIMYQFDEPQDIVALDIQFYKGNERVRKLKVTGSGGFNEEIESSGNTNGYERFNINTDETAWLNMEGQGLGSNDWLSIKEVSKRSNGVGCFE